MLDSSGLQPDSSTTPSPPHSDWELPILQELEELPTLGLDEDCEDEPGSVLCSICRKNLVKVQEVALVSKRKRRRVVPPPILSSMTVCENCIQHDPRDLTSASNRSKLVVKRQRAKVRNEDDESDAVKKLKELRNQLLNQAKDLSDTERKRMQQILRNRISAQQSRDRKKLLLTHVERKNNELVEENERLRGKIEELHRENRYLKGQLERYTSGGGSGSGLMMLGLGTVLMVVMTVSGYYWQSPIPEHNTRVLSSSSLMEYRGPQSFYPHRILPSAALL